MQQLLVEAFHDGNPYILRFVLFYSHYHAWGLKSSYVDIEIPFKAEFLSLQETLQRLGHVGRRIDIFKIDCEG